jgi:peptide/nickel transport system ATP-binding protein
MSTPLLEARGIVKRHRSAGGVTTSVDAVDLRIDTGESVGLVGESGSGKTTLARMLAGMTDADAGQLLWQGQPLPTLDRAGRAAYRRAVQYVFQNPVGALNPRHRVGSILQRTLRSLTTLNSAARRARIDAVAEQVGLDRNLLGRFPHQLSGGQAQRVAIARALLGQPRLLILDEPVSALDVSLQAQILNLLDQLRDRHGLAYLFISHDLAVVERLCPRIAVMRDGAILEQGGRETILNNPRHAYTRQLLQAVPRLPQS